tara:strand:+ start:172 stop:606 length:435 start_codon:yes stop_codon:yes gene_type:complete
MGNYLSYYNEYSSSAMEISDDDDTIIISRSFSDSALEITTEKQRDTLVKNIRELKLNKCRVENAISCIYQKNKMEDCFKNKIKSLEEKLYTTENEVDVLHLKNVRLQNKYDSLVIEKNKEIKELKQLVSIMKLQYEHLKNKKDQ